MKTAASGEIRCGGYVGVSLPGGRLPGYSIVNFQTHNQEKIVESQEFPFFREFLLFIIAIWKFACYNI